MIPISDICGYIGSGFLKCRFIPVICKYYKTRTLNYNPYLVLLELSTDIFLYTHYEL